MYIGALEEKVELNIVNTTSMSCMCIIIESLLNACLNCVQNIWCNGHDSAIVRGTANHRARIEGITSGQHTRTTAEGIEKKTVHPLRAFGTQAAVPLKVLKP